MGAIYRSIHGDAHGLVAWSRIQSAKPQHVIRRKYKTIVVNIASRTISSLSSPLQKADRVALCVNINKKVGKNPRLNFTFALGEF